MSSKTGRGLTPTPDVFIERVAAPVREQVEELLREAIVSQRLAPGERLVERELVERFGVSRATVREALRHLAAEGLVTTIPQKGVVVSLPTRTEAEELYELRALMEALVARQCAERASRRQISALGRAFARVEKTLLSDDKASLQARLEAKNEFYETLLVGAGNETVRRVLGQLQARISVLRATSLSAPGRSRDSVEEIRRIVEAVENHDGEAAAQAASHHVRQAAAVLFKALDDGIASTPVLSTDGPAEAPSRQRGA
jgi:GntR family transcriptional regulator, trigonelline degradation regulator